MAPKIAKPDQYNQEAQLTDPTLSGVFQYEITSLPADFQSPSAMCGNWLSSQPTGQLVYACLLFLLCILLPI